MSELKKKKAFVVFIAATGHINPTICVCSELVKKGVDVSFYSVDKYKHLIERAGCKFVPYINYPRELLIPQGLEHKNYILDYVNRFLTFTDQEMPRLIDDVDREQPDMIICDQFSIHARFLSDIIKTRYEKGLSSTRPPKMIEICTSFIFRTGVYPTESENRDMIYSNKDNWCYLILLAVFAKQLWLCWKYNLSTLDPIGYIFNYSDPRLAIVSICPDLQPKRDLFERLNYKFVGMCVDESVRAPDIEDARLKQVLNSFPPINPLSSIDQRSQSNKRLVYVSLGTVVNDNEPIIKKIIAAISMYQSRSNLFDLTVLVSIGEPLFKRFQSENVQLPDNFVIQPSVPQIEVLKRAALFITHSGMNSSSEVSVFSFIHV